MKARDKVLEWLTETGIEGWLGIAVGVVLLVMGFKIGAGIAFGFFLCKNWEWIKKGISEYISNQLDKSQDKGDLE